MISAFLKLSQMYPNLKLVLETFNGKNKGLTAQVDVSMSLDLQKTADDLEACIFDFDSIFKVVSDLCNSCTDLEERISTCSFGFRTVHKNRTTSANVHCCINKQDNFQQSADCQIYPMAFLHPAIAPFLQFLDSTSPVVRVQMYLEPWSAHKNCNTKYSIKSTGQNLKKAIEGKSLNVSVLKAGLPNLAETLDASFRNWQRTSGTRFEVAVRLKLKHFSNPAQTLFDIGDGLNTAWAHLESSFTFSDIHSVVMHSSLCTAATLLGYRASLDALNDNALEANQQSTILEYVRYMNAIIHSIPNGRFILNNPKLFLANIGFQAGRPAALTPTLPRLVRHQIAQVLPGLKLNVDDPPLISEPCQNVINDRIELLKSSESLKASMVMCSCGMGFFGCDRVAKLHIHLLVNPSHNSDKYTENCINGLHWYATFIKQKQELEEWIWNKGTMEQQALFQNASSGKNTCCVGKAGTGKTFGVKKLFYFAVYISGHRSSPRLTAL